MQNVKDFHEFSDNATEVILESGKKMVMACTEDQFCEGLEESYNGNLVQDAFYFLTAEEREFLISGITPEEWDKTFGV